ncbi:MAG: ABC transporter substrate-binding protein [Acidobacteria bacterium]|nr:ABC transporter substrate-binding protein [Acidobacteriota bacterium]
MRIKVKWLAIFLVLGLVVAACGTSGEEESTTTEAETTATTEAAPTETTEAAPTETTEAEEMILTDVGVDLEAGTITVGLLSDLTGVFSALVQPVVTGYEAQVEAINAAGGINGLTIVLEIRDTGYSVDTHVQQYNEIKDSVVALGHSTGSPHTVAINQQLVEDNMFAVPLTWYSGWSDPALNANLVPHGTPYCIESMNVLGYLTDQNPDAATVAIASNAGDFGEDSAEGAKLAAEALGLEVVYDGQGKVNAADEATLAEVATAIVASGADIVWVTTSPGAYSGIYGQALAAGMTALWSGSFVAWNFGFLGPDSPIRDAIQRDWTFAYPIAPWSADNPGTNAARELIQAYDPEAPPYEYYLEGIVEAQLLEAILNAAYDSGDMTRAGVLAAAKSLESMSWDGLAPDQSFVGEPNDTVQRLVNIVKPSAADLEAGGSGLELIEANYTSDIAAAYQFDEACFDAGFGG